MVLNVGDNRQGGAFMSDKELRLMVETRPSETIAYIKKLEAEIMRLTSQLHCEQVKNE